MISKECRATRQEIDELELTERPSERVAAHLPTCAPCREFQIERAELRELVGGLEPVVAPADFDMRLRAKIAAERSGSSQPFTFARLFGTPALAAAALFVVVAGTLVWIAQRGSTISPPAVTREVASNPTNVLTAPSDDPTKAVPSTDSGQAPKRNDELVAVSDRKRPVTRGPRSRDYTVLPAGSVRQTDQAFVNVGSKPVVFGLEDERGTNRKISVPPVGFGAQSLVDNRVPVSYTGRVW